jgi:hypothetical protein
MKTKITRGRLPIRMASIMVCCLLASCFATSNYGTIGIATTRNIELPGEKGARVHGESCSSVIFVFPTDYPTIGEAISDALMKGKGDLLRDAVIDYEVWGIPFLYLRECWIAEGTILKLQQPRTAAPSPPDPKN